MIEIKSRKNKQKLEKFHITGVRKTWLQQVCARVAWLKRPRSKQRCTSVVQVLVVKKKVHPCVGKYLLFFLKKSDMLPFKMWIFKKVSGSPIELLAFFFGRRYDESSEKPIPCAAGNPDCAGTQPEAEKWTKSVSSPLPYTTHAYQKWKQFMPCFKTKVSRVFFGAKNM